MAQASKKAQRTIDIWKKKRWYKLVAPGMFNNLIIGETPALESEAIQGRSATANLMTITNDIKKQHVDVTFSVTKVQGDTAFTEMTQYAINPAYIKRSVRRNRSRVDDSFVVITSDGWKLQVKPFLLTRFATPKSIIMALRRKTREFLLRAIAKNTKDTILQDIISTKLQRALRDAVKNIYNLRSCEIRTLDVLGQASERPLFAGGQKPAENSEKGGEQEQAQPAEEKEKEEKKKKEEAGAAEKPAAEKPAEKTGEAEEGAGEIKEPADEEKKEETKTGVQSEPAEEKEKKAKPKRAAKKKEKEVKESEEKKE